MIRRVSSLDLASWFVLAVVLAGVAAELLGILPPLTEAYR